MTTPTEKDIKRVEKFIPFDWFITHDPPVVLRKVAELIVQVREETREKDAKLVERHRLKEYRKAHYTCCLEIAEAIRASKGDKNGK